MHLGRWGSVPRPHRTGGIEPREVLAFLAALERRDGEGRALTVGDPTSGEGAIFYAAPSAPVETPEPHPDSSEETDDTEDAEEVSMN